MKTMIIAVSVDNNNARSICEWNEHASYSDIQQMVDTINKGFDSVTLNEDFFVYELTDFMDLCNDQEFSLDEYFIGYVNID